jgi:hypothetical protein
MTPRQGHLDHGVGPVVDIGDEVVEDGVSLDSEEHAGLAERNVNQQPNPTSDLRLLPIEEGQHGGARRKSSQGMPSSSER